MTIETTLYTRLTGFAGLSALVAARIHPNLLPQNTPYPAISYRRVTAERPSAMGGDCGVVRGRFQFDVWAELYSDAVAVRAQLRLALQRWRNIAGTVVQDGFLLTQLDLFEPDSGPNGLHHFADDYEIIFEE